MVRHSSLLSLALIGMLNASLAIAQNPDDKTKSYWQAARSGDVAKVKALVEQGVDIDAVTEFNCGAIYFAANRNHADVIKLLAEAGANVNLRDTDYGFTPVQMAAWLGHTEATDALIDAGASKTDVTGSAFAAASNGHADTVKLIVEKMKLSVPQINALWTTAKNTGHPNVGKMLEELGAKPPETKKQDAEVTDEAESDEATDENDTDASTRFDFESDKPIPVARAANWPAFRGAARAGVADGQHPPAAFNLETNRNIKWQTAVDGLGLSSPVIWNDRVYITTAVSSATKQSIEDNGLGWIAAVPENEPHQWNVICYSLATGEKIWEQTACEGIPKSKRHWKASQANSTCVTDGENLVAFFGSEGLYCYDMDGHLKWKKDLGQLDAGWYIDSTFPWGFASSPIIYGDSVIVQCDVYGNPFIARLSLDGGELLWQTDRENELPSWGTPLVVTGSERDELITNASKSIRGYDPDSGKLLWQINGNSPITVASPVASDGLMVATGGYKTPKPIYVVRAGMALGDITPNDESESASVAWSQQTGGVYIVTPLFYRGVLYMCKQNSIVSAYDPETGERHYQKRLGTGAITASPVAADGRIYFVGEDGRVVVISAGENFDEVSVNELGQPTLATPAISNGTIVFRTVKGLVAVAHDPAQP